MPGSEYYDHTTFPQQGAQGASAAMRAELEAIESGFGKVIALSGNANKVVKVNVGATAQAASIMTDNGSTVSIAGALSVTGAISFSTVLGISSGGTGSGTASGARAALGLEIGSDVQAWNSVLDNTTASFLTAQETKINYITVTQAVDLDTIETRVNALDAAVILQGGWDASAGSFPGGGTAQAGDSYYVTTGGTVDSVAFSANDRIVAITDNASTSTYASNWLHLDYSDQVTSVGGQTGVITLADLSLEVGVDIQAYDADTAKIDTLQTWTAAQRPTVTSLSWSTNVATPTLDTSNDFSVTLENAQADTIANPSDIDSGCVGQTGTFIITQNGTGASTLAWGSYYKNTAGESFSDAVATTLSSVTTYDYKVISATHIELIKVGTAT